VHHVPPRDRRQVWLSPSPACAERLWVAPSRHPCDAGVSVVVIAVPQAGIGVKTQRCHQTLVTDRGLLSFFLCFYWPRRAPTAWQVDVGSRSTGPSARDGCDAAWMPNRTDRSRHCTSCLATMKIRTCHARRRLGALARPPPRRHTEPGDDDLSKLRPSILRPHETAFVHASASLNRIRTRLRSRWTSAVELEEDRLLRDAERVP